MVNKVPPEAQEIWDAEDVEIKAILKHIKEMNAELDRIQEGLNALNKSTMEDTK